MSTKPPSAYDPRQQNPYADLAPAAAPAQPAYAPQYGAPMPIGIWARGDTMIFHKSAVFPDICLRSGKPADGSRFKQKLTWHPPWITVTVLAGLLIYIILAAILTKTAQIDVGVLPQFKKRRLIHMTVGTLAILASIAGFFGGIAVLASQEPNPGPIGPIMMLASAVLFLASLIYVTVAPRMFKIEKITDSYVYLRGIHPDVIRQLPVCPFAWDP